MTFTMTNMYELLNKLASKLTSFEVDSDGYINFKNDEFEIDNVLFIVSGNISYTINDSVGDYYTPSYTSVNFLNADLDVKYYDEESETDITLNDAEIKHLIKNI